MIMIIIAVVVVLILLWVISTYNKFVKLQNDQLVSSRHTK